MKHILDKYRAVIFLLEVFALVPFNVKVVNNLFQIKHKKFYASLQLIYLAILILLLGNGIFIHKLFNNRKLHIFDSVMYVGTTIAFMIIISETLRNHDKHEQLISIVFTISQLLLVFVGGRREKKSWLFRYNTTFFISLLVILTNFVLLLALFYLRKNIYFNYYLEIILPLFGLVIRIFQVEFYLHILTDECLNNINAFLHDFNADHTDDNVMHLLQRIKRVFYEIWRAHTLINELFGWGLFCVLILYFFSFVCDTYWIVLSCLGSVNPISGIESFLINVPSFICMGRLLHANHKLRNSIAITINLLHKIENQSSGNSRIRNKFNEISYQFIQLQMNLTTPFYPLNYSFLHRVISGTATFVIIMVQFHYTNEYL